jgi:hypothetical protein
LGPLPAASVQWIEEDSLCWDGDQTFKKYSHAPSAGIPGEERDGSYPLDGANPTPGMDPSSSRALVPVRGPSLSSATPSQPLEDGDLNPYAYRPRENPINWKDILQDRKRPNRRSKDPREFTGETEVWEDYLKHFQVIADWNCWDDKDKADGLYIALGSPASEFIYSQEDGETDTFEKLSTLLESRFGAARNIAMDKKQLRERKKQKNESYATMGQEIQRLAKRVFKGAPMLAEREGRDYFIRALPTTLRVAVAACNPSTVNECIDHVNRLSAILDTEDEYSETKRARWVDRPVGQASELTKIPEGIEEPRRDQEEDAPRPVALCWDCGELGHRRNKCPLHYKFKPADWEDYPRKPRPDREDFPKRPRQNREDFPRKGNFPRRPMPDRGEDPRRPRQEYRTRPDRGGYNRNQSGNANRPQ